jgi:hypothetical protein
VEELLNGFPVLVGRADVLLHGGVEHLLPRYMNLRRNARGGNKDGQDNCKKRTCRSHRRSSSRLF